MPTTVIEYSYYSLSDAVVLQVYEMVWCDVVKMMWLKSFPFFLSAEQTTLHGWIW